MGNPPFWEINDLKTRLSGSEATENLGEIYGIWTLTMAHRVVRRPRQELRHEPLAQERAVWITTDMDGFPWVSMGFPWGFPWGLHGVSMGFPWGFHGFHRCFLFRHCFLGPWFIIDKFIVPTPYRDPFWDQNDDIQGPILSRFNSSPQAVWASFGLCVWNHHLLHRFRNSFMVSIWESKRSSVRRWGLIYHSDTAKPCCHREFGHPRNSCINTNDMTAGKYAVFPWFRYYSGASHIKVQPLVFLRCAH